MPSNMTSLLVGNINGVKYILGVPKKEFLVVAIVGSVFFSVALWLGFDFFFYIKRRKQSLKDEVIYQNDRKKLCTPDAGTFIAAEDACGPGISISGRRKSSVNQLIEFLQYSNKNGNENGLQNGKGIIPSKAFSSSIKPIEEENEPMGFGQQVADVNNSTDLKLVKYDNYANGPFSQYKKNSVHPYPSIYPGQRFQDTHDQDAFADDYSASSSYSMFMKKQAKTLRKNKAKHKTSSEHTRNRKEKRMHKKAAKHRAD